MASRARALAVLQAMTRNSAPCSSDQELGALGGVAGDGAAGLGAVGQAGRVADEGEAGVRQTGHQGAQDGEAAEAGIEDADGGRRGQVCSWLGP